MTKALPAGIRLQMLIKDHHKDILERERNNGKFIHLYNIGTYWVAFERSAFRVDNIFQGCEISLFMVSGYPEYVVMASVHMMRLMIIFGNILFITTNLIIRFCLFLRLL